MNGTERRRGSLRALPLALAVVLVLGALADVGTGMAQLNPQTQQFQDLVRRYADSGYAVVGPAGVVAFTADALTLRNPYKDMTLSLRGQTVAVIGPDARPLSRSAVQTGSNVYVCRKGTETTMILLP